MPNATVTERRWFVSGIAINAAHSPAGVYIPPVHLTSHKARATKSISRRRGGDVGSSPGLGHLTLLSHSNKPTAHGQRELSLCVPARRSTGGEDVDRQPRMTTLRQQDTTSKKISSTSSTSAVFQKVDEQNARRHGGQVLSSTSSTSFSKGGVMCGRMRVRGRARSELSPFRETGRRSRRVGVRSMQSCDYVVHFGVFGEVDGGRQ